MNPSIQAQASQSAQQGQQLLSQDKATAAQSGQDYNTYSSEASNANKNLESEADYMKGAGSGENVYNRELGTLESQNGFNPQQLSDANSTLFKLSGALNSANNQFSTPGGVGAYGVSAPALSAYEGSILAPLTTGVQTANTQVGTLNNELGTFETGAGQATTSQVQSEQNTVTALTQAAQNYQSQASAALQNMQFYSQLASTQGSLNASEQQAYAAATQDYAAATQAAAQTKYILSQTTGQNITNQADINQLPNGTSIGGFTSQQRKPAPPAPNKAPAAAPAPRPSGGGGILHDLNKPFNWFNNSVLGGAQ